MQASPGLSQKALEVQVPAAQSPEQHSEPVAQVLPPGLQEHWPEEHTFEQQSELRVQLALGPAQAQVPPAQRFEQHCRAELHEAPVAPQVDTGSAQCWVASQYDEQQSAAAAQEAPSAAHGVAQRPLRHRLVQQFESDAQGFPVALHCGGSHVPLHACTPVLESGQHCDGDTQVAPGGRQVCAGPHHRSPLKLGLQPPVPGQHSLEEAHRAPADLQVCTVSQVPSGQEPEQHSEPATQVTPSGLHCGLEGELAPPPSWHAAPASSARQLARAATDGRGDGAMGR